MDLTIKGKNSSIMILQFHDNKKSLLSEFEVFTEEEVYLIEGTGKGSVKPEILDDRSLTASYLILMAAAATDEKPLDEALNMLKDGKSVKIKFSLNESLSDMSVMIDPGKKLQITCVDAYTKSERKGTTCKFNLKDSDENLKDEILICMASALAEKFEEWDRESIIQEDLTQISGQPNLQFSATELKKETSASKSR